MTRRLAIAMLATVWAILIAAGLMAYLTTRSVLLANMDQAMLLQMGRMNDSDPLVVKNDLGQKVPVEMDDAQHRPTLISARFVTLGDGTRERTISAHAFVHHDNGTFEPVIATRRESAEPFDRLMSRLAWALALAGCAGGLVAAAVARWVAGVALRPLRSTAETIGQIDERNLSRRIDASELAPELVPVAEKLNEMLARLESSFDNRKRFLADASHELRTPVAAMVTTLEVSLRRLRDAESYRDTIQICLADARLMRTLVDALMAQARSEIGAFKEEPVMTDVTALLRESVTILGALAEQKHVTLSESIDEMPMIELARGRLKQAVMGLLENAIDHNRPGGNVEIAASVENGQFQISISDTGPGIALEHLTRIFEPFYRTSASRDTNGHMGLGLYLVKTHVEAMDGKCSVASDPGRGSKFCIVLPAPKTAEKPKAMLATG